MLLDVFEVNFPFWFRIFGREGKCPTEEFCVCLLLRADCSNILVLALRTEKGVGNVKKVPFYTSGVSRGSPGASTAMKQP